MSRVKSTAIYKNPFSLSIAFAVMDDVLEYDLPVTGEDETKTYHDPFDYMNLLLSAMTGEEIEVWTACEVSDKSTSGVNTLNVKGYWAYGKSGASSSYLSYF